MKFLHFLFVSFVVLAQTCSPFTQNVIAENSNHDHDENDRNNIVGLYTFLANVAGSNNYGILNFHKDGTVEGGETQLSGQFFVADPNGILAPPSEGEWEKTGESEYKIFLTNVVNFVNSPPQQFPTTPMFRTGIYGVLKYNAVNQTFTGIDSIYRYDLSDSSLSHGTFLVDVPINGTKLQKLKHPGK